MPVIVITTVFRAGPRPTLLLDARSGKFVRLAFCVGNTGGVKSADRLSSAEAALMHPRHLAAQPVLAELITALRACANVKDGYEFQRELLARVLEVEADRNAFGRAVKRMRAGKSPQPDAPEPRSGLDPADLETWQVEYDLCERLARQYRCVGDALAWRVFGFQRRNIIALCQNAPPGVMAGKQGLAAEVARVDQAYREDGQFAILHDLTNCLRIGDVTVFGNDGSVQTLEVKSDPGRHSPAQRRRIKAARDAVLNGGPLPGTDPMARLHDLDISFNTHLDLLRTGTERAARDGMFTVKVPGARALLVTDMYGCSAQGWTEEDFTQRLARKASAARRRGRIDGDSGQVISATSLDSVSRDPQRVPFAAYPLHPVACARLIGDLAVFTVQTSGPALADSLRAAGFDARWARPPGTGDLRAGEVVMELRAAVEGPVHRGIRIDLARTLQVRRAELDRYLIEMIEQDTWAAGTRSMLADYRLARRPWPTYRNEDQTWI